jgi:hypothetical protein
MSRSATCVSPCRRTHQRQSTEPCTTHTAGLERQGTGNSSQGDLGGGLPAGARRRARHPEPNSLLRAARATGGRTSSRRRSERTVASAAASPAEHRTAEIAPRRRICDRRRCTHVSRSACPELPIPVTASSRSCYRSVTLTQPGQPLCATLSGMSRRTESPALLTVPLARPHQSRGCDLAFS